MASAGSHILKSVETGVLAGLKPFQWRLLALAMLLSGCFGFGWIQAQSGHRLMATVAIFLIVAFCTSWGLHLQLGLLPPVWSALLAVLLFCQFLLPILHATAITPTLWVSALGCGVFVYCMLWVCSMYEREHGLRPFATSALLLSIGILAKPAVAVSCAILALVFFLDRRRTFGGMLGSALLLFTPALLSGSSLLLLQYLSYGSVAFSGIVAFHEIVTKGVGQASLASLLQASSGLCLSFTVLLSHLLERKLGVSDLAYFFLLLFLTTAGVAHWMPDALSPIDISFITCAGAACLVALAPPRKVSSRILVLAGSFVGLYVRIWLH